jgi:hypothetical protein
MTRAVSPVAHQTLVRWKSSSGLDPIGEETAHAASAIRSSAGARKSALKRRLIDVGGAEFTQSA